MKEFELKYKSALGSATTMYACAKESNDKKIIQSLELIFPELKKTKDELIKEELIHFLETCRDPRFVGNRKQDEWIEWLEKQGDQKSKQDEHKDSYIDGIRKELLGIEDNAKNINGLTESQWVAIRAAHRFLGEHFAPVWSEEDENIFASLLGTLTWTTNNNYHCSEVIPKYMHWLENLKQRLNGTE